MKRRLAPTQVTTEKVFGLNGLWRKLDYTPRKNDVMASAEAKTPTVRQKKILWNSYSV